MKRLSVIFAFSFLKINDNSASSGIDLIFDPIKKIEENENQENGIAQMVIMEPTTIEETKKMGTSYKPFRYSIRKSRERMKQSNLLLQIPLTTGEDFSDDLSIRYVFK